MKKKLSMIKVFLENNIHQTEPLQPEEISNKYGISLEDLDKLVSSDGTEWGRAGPYLIVKDPELLQKLKNIDPDELAEDISVSYGMKISGIHMGEETSSKEQLRQVQSPEFQYSRRSSKQKNAERTQDNAWDDFEDGEDVYSSDPRVKGTYNSAADNEWETEWNNSPKNMSLFNAAQKTNPGRPSRLNQSPVSNGEKTNPGLPSNKLPVAGIKPRQRKPRK